MWIEARSEPEAASAIVMRIDGVQVIIPPNRIYTLNKKVQSSLVMVSSDYPIVVNYFCNLELNERINVEVATSVETSLEFD
jgi:hypothetical protein